MRNYKIMEINHEAAVNTQHGKLLYRHKLKGISIQHISSLNKSFAC